MYYYFFSIKVSLALYFINYSIKCNGLYFKCQKIVEKYKRTLNRPLLGDQSGAIIFYELKYRERVKVAEHKLTKTS